MVAGVSHNIELCVQATGGAFKLSAWQSDEGSAFYKTHVASFLSLAWRHVQVRYPRASAEMLAAVPAEYRLEGTGFTKVTLAVNNPTHVHFDHNNFGITCLVCIDLDGDLDGGSHVMYNLDLTAAVVVQTNTEGV